MHSSGRMEDLILTMNATIQKIRNRSNVILWRQRPRLSFDHRATADNLRIGPKYDDYYPEKEDYEQDVAMINISCRLACYPCLTDEEAISLGCAEEGDAFPFITSSAAAV